MSRPASWLAALALVLALAPAARAEVWAYVDEKGVPHFASEKIDERYELFFRTESTAGAATGTARAVAVPTAAAKLIAFFEFSPGYKQVQHHLRAASLAHGVDLELLKALIATESGFDASVVSPSGAVGLMQIMPATAQHLGLKADAKTTIEQKLVDPAVNIRIGAKYLRYLLNRFSGQLELALAAYNAGEGSVLRAGKQVPNFRETRDYVTTVLQIYAMLKPPAALGSYGSYGSAAGRAHVEFLRAAPSLPVAATAAAPHPDAPFD